MKKNFDWSSETTNIKKNTFSVPMALRKKTKKIKKDEN